MRYQFVVILKKGSERATNILGFLLCLFSAFVFLYTGILAFVHTQGVSGSGWFAGGTSTAWLSFATGLALLTGLALTYIAHRRDPHGKVRYRFLLILAAIAWFALTPVPYIGVFFVLLSFLEHQTKRPLEIGFDNDRIVINTLFKQRFDWEAFNNIILKDGLLTLDFKNNKLIQREITEDDEDDDADEDEFNDYCRARLAAAMGK